MGCETHLTSYIVVVTDDLEQVPMGILPTGHTTSVYASSIVKALHELLETLDDTYERALQEIPTEKWHHAHRFFQCLVAAIRPLCVEELAEIFAIKFHLATVPNLMEGWRPENAEDAVLSTCSTLFTIVEN